MLSKRRNDGGWTANGKTRGAAAAARPTGVVDAGAVAELDGKSTAGRSISGSCTGAIVAPGTEKPGILTAGTRIGGTRCIRAGTVDAEDEPGSTGSGRVSRIGPSVGSRSGISRTRPRYGSGVVGRESGGAGGGTGAGGVLLALLLVVLPALARPKVRSARGRVAPGLILSKT